MSQPSLFAPKPAPELMDPEQRYLYEERWRIVHFDGELPEDEAKRLALEELR